MTLILENLTVGILTYLSGSISVPASGTLEIKSVKDQLSLSTEGSLRRDILQSKISVNDGINSFSGTDALDYLAKIPTDYIAYSIDKTYPDGTIDTFGNLLTAKRNLQIEKNFFSGKVSDYVEVHIAGSSRAVLESSGHAVFKSGTDTTSYLLVKTTETLKYHSYHELWASFSIAFAAPVDTNNFQRIGPKDQHNGFMVGLNGNTPTLWHFQNDTVFTYTVFNRDKLDGTKGSKFTQDGVPVPINWNNLNVFGVTFGWLGTAPVKYYVQAPDGHFVNFHTITWPNNHMDPHIANPELPISFELSKTGSDSTDLQAVSACWAGGTNYESSPGMSIREEFTNENPLPIGMSNEFKKEFKKLIATNKQIQEGIERLYDLLSEAFEIEIE